jgi:hypothetical protein
MMVLRRARDEAAGPPPLTAYLDWGHTGFDERVTSSDERDRAVARVQDFVDRAAGAQAPGRDGQRAVHELLMNAMYDAPVDERGVRATPAIARRWCSCRPTTPRACAAPPTAPGSIVQVRDRFGGLQRRHVVDGLARGLAGGEMDQSHGGAGLGMSVCHHNALAIFFDVARGRHTEVTAMLELDLNLREVRTLARSLHLFGELA